MGGVLDGIRVLDFGRFIAGPWCGALLGDFGADVIRIDKRGGGEDRHVLPMSDDMTGAMFLQMNRNKRGMTLDPTKPEGREIQEKLVATADVVLASMPPRAHLDDNDGHGFFERLGDSLITGPTLTNVNDFRAILVL